MGISFWIGIAWRGWTPAAVWVSSLVSYGVWAACAFFPGAFAAAGIVAGLVTSLCTPRPTRAGITGFAVACGFVALIASLPRLLTALL